MRQIVLIPDGVGGYVVEVPSLPDCRSKGKTASEAIRNVKQAIYAQIEHLKSSGQPVPEATVVDVVKAEGVVSYNLLLREDVSALAQETFPNEDLQTVLDIVDEYGKQPFEIDRERVQIAVIRLSEGNVDRLRKLVVDAKRDYRNILMGYGMKFGAYP